MVLSAWIATILEIPAFHNNQLVIIISVEKQHKPEQFPISCQSNQIKSIPETDESKIVSGNE